MINLSTSKIAEIGNKLTELFNGIKISNSELKIYVDDYSFLKIDEDLYYRQNPNGEDFKESEEQIDVLFDNVKISILKT